MSSIAGQNDQGQKPIRVAFFIDALDADAGTENQLRLLLASLDRARVSPSLFILHGQARLSQGHASTRVTRLDVVHLLSLSGLRGLVKAASTLRREGFDLVVTFFIDANLLGTLAARRAGIPVVSSRRNLGRGYWHTPAHLWRLRRLNAMTQWFLSNSQAVRQYTIESERVDPSRITVIRNAVDTDRFRCPSEEERLASRSQLGVREDELVVACVGNLRPVKDHPTLLRAFSMAAGANPRLQLLLVGDGPEESRLRALAAELSIQGRVRFLGSRPDVVPILHAADALTLSSVAESLPNAICEALACGHPVAATAVGGVPELLESRPWGRLAPPSSPSALAEALLEVVSEPMQRAEVRQAARAFAVSEFSIPVVIEQWHQFFERCVAESRSSRNSLA